MKTEQDRSSEIMDLDEPIDFIAALRQGQVSQSEAREFLQERVLDSTIWLFPNEYRMAALTMIEQGLLCVRVH